MALATGAQPHHPLGPPMATGQRSGDAAPRKDYRTEFHLVTKHRKELKSSTLTNTNPLPGHIYVAEGAGKRALIDLCIEKCREEGKTVFFVVEKRNGGLAETIVEHVNRVGYQFPKAIYDQAFQQVERRLSRADRIAKRSNIARLPEPKTDAERRRAIKELFPLIPEDDLKETVASAWQKGKIGNAKNLNLGRRIQLAVCARIRHGHTVYDDMLTWLRQNNPEHERGELRHYARQQIESEVLEVMKKWRGEDDEEIQETWREIIVLDDDDEDSDVQIPPAVATPPPVEHAGAGPVIYDEDGNPFHLGVLSSESNAPPKPVFEHTDHSHHPHSHPAPHFPVAARGNHAVHHPDVAIPSIERTHSFPLSHQRTHRSSIADVTRVQDSGRITKRHDRARSRPAISAAKLAEYLDLTHSDGVNIGLFPNDGVAAKSRNEGFEQLDYSGDPPEAPLASQRKARRPEIMDISGLRARWDSGLHAAAEHIEPNPYDPQLSYTRHEQDLGQSGHQFERGAGNQGTYVSYSHDESHQQPGHYPAFWGREHERSPRLVHPHIPSMPHYPQPPRTVPPLAGFRPAWHRDVIDLT